MKTKIEFQVIPSMDIDENGIYSSRRGSIAGQNRMRYPFSPVHRIENYMFDGISGIYTINMSNINLCDATIPFFKGISKLMKNPGPILKGNSPNLLWYLSGGIRTIEQVEIILNKYQPDRIVLGGSWIEMESESKAISILVEKFGPKFVADVAIGYANDNSGNLVLKKNKWQEDVAIEFSTAMNLLKNAGVQQIFVNSKEVAGTGEGPDLKLALSVKEFGFQIYAGSGVSKLSHILDAYDLGLYGVISGTAFLNGSLTITKVKEYLKLQNHPERAKDEVLLGNFPTKGNFSESFKKNYPQWGYTTKRKGKNAYDEQGNLTKNQIPVFVKKWEFGGNRNFF